MNLDAPKPITRRELFLVATTRAKLDKKQGSEKSPQLWAEAVAQVGEGWLEGLFLFTGSGNLLATGKEVVAKSAYRFGV